MAITVKHTKVSTIPDGDDTSVVRPSDWNADHQLVGTVPVANGGTGAAILTGYVKGNGTSTMTASATVPSTDVTGLGTMSTQNSNNISVTGGTMNGVTISDYVATAQKGVANGVASLDGSGTVPVSQLPSAVLGALSYQGTWNASTNTPTLTSSVGTKGYYYVVSVAGSTNLNGITDWQVGDWAVYNGTTWQKIDNTDAVTSVNGKTGTVVLTNTDISGFGTMSTQNASSVAITGGTLNGVAIGGTTAGDGTFDILTANVSRIHTATADSLTIGTLSYTPANALISSQSSVATYNQVILQNSNTGATASADFIVNNSNSTDSTYYGDFGMNSNGFTGTGAFNQPNTVYLTGTTADLAIGTTTSNSIHFVVAGGATDAMTINTTKSIAFNGSYGTAGQVLTSGGSTGVPTWTTPTTGTVTSVSGTTGRITSTGGTTPVIDLASGIATAGTTGSSTLIPVVTIDTYGRVTGITTASNPQGTVTSVAALTLGTTGTDLSSTVATGTTTPVITLNVPTASATNRGALSAADWSTFNSKAPGTTFTTNYVPYGQGTTTLNQSSSFTYDGTTLTAPKLAATASVTASGTKGAISYGTLSYSDSNHLATFQTAVNAYAQVEIQNTQAGTTASADMIVANDLTTASTYYGDFGINSSLFSGTGSLGLANATYLTATTGDLSIGTTTSNAIHFVIGGSATDAMSISTAGNVTVTNTLTATKYVGVSGGTF